MYVAFTHNYFIRELKSIKCFPVELASYREILIVCKSHKDLLTVGGRIVLVYELLIVESAAGNEVENSPCFILYRSVSV